jgi:tRNA 2-thiouridine synthesizing protein B
MLYIVNKSPFSSHSLESCLKIAKEGDSVLLIEDGVLGASHELVVKAQEKGIAVYVLKADADVRELKSSVPVIDYGGFVDLVVADTVVTWI